MKSAQLTLHGTVLLLSLGSWLLLFTVEVSANASDGEEVFQPERLGAYFTSMGFATVTGLLLALWCMGASGRMAYTSVLPAEEEGDASLRRGILFWHYAIHGTLVLATICWICIHSVNLQHQQVWRGVLTLYSLLSLTLICFAQRKAVGRGLCDAEPPSRAFLRHKLESEGLSARKSSSRSSAPSSGGKTTTGRWRPLFQDPSFQGEVQGLRGRAQSSRSSKKNEWRSFVFEEQAEAMLSPSSPERGWSLPYTYQKNLIKLRGISRRHSDSEGSARRSSFASSDQADSSHPLSPGMPRIFRTQSQPSVSSGFSDISDPASPSSASLLRAASKDSRRASKDSRRDSRHSAESEGGVSEDLDHVVHIGVLESVCEEDQRPKRLDPVEERPEALRPISPSPPMVPATPPAGSGPELGQLRIPSPSGATRLFTLDSSRTLNSEGMEGLLEELKVEDRG